MFVLTGYLRRPFRYTYWIFKYWSNAQQKFSPVYYLYYLLHSLLLSIWYPVQVVCFGEIHTHIGTVYTEKAAHYLLISISQQ